MPPLLLLIIASIGGSVYGSQKVILISFDGFRHDLLNETLVPNIHKWANQSAWFVNGVQSQRITMTAPNHMSIVTGLREVDHGIVGNFFFDEKTQEMFDVYNGTGKAGIVEDSEKAKWYKGDPIWSVNQRQGGKSAVFYWPIGDFETANNQGIHVRPWRQTGGLDSWKADVDSIVGMLNETNFVAWYISEPDGTLHKHGFHHHGEFAEVIAKLDNLFEYLTQKLEKEGRKGDTNVILTADHGHIQIERGQILCVNHAMPGVYGEDYLTGEYTIFPKNESFAREAYDALKTLIDTKKLAVNLYWKNEIPDSWYFAHAHRVGKIYLEPRAGGHVVMKCKYHSVNDDHSSAHGQDPHLPEMHALLVMNGPAFTPKKIREIPQNVDLYPMMGKILGLEMPRCAGTMDIVGNALV